MLLATLKWIQIAVIKLEMEHSWRHNGGKNRALLKSIMGNFKSIIGSSLVVTMTISFVAAS